MERREYGVFDITPEVVDAQQKLAYTFLEAGLINEKINVQDAVLSD
ncbi:hypothetical protein [Aeribacillus pallidus]|nr:hypothetical protein [Aeribacillus pallidus]